MNEADGMYCALYADNRLVLDGWEGMQPEDLLPRLVGVTIESVTIENTNLPFYDDDENELEHQAWPATIDDLPEDEG